MIKSPERRTVLEDMDGVLFDFEGAINTALSVEFPELNLADPASHFYVYKRYTDPRVVEFIQHTKNSQGFFRNLPPLPGAIEQWQTLQEGGYAPRICSAPLSENPYCEHEKREVIDHYFGSRAVDAAFIGKNKQPIDGICLIDDRPKMENGSTWQRVIFTHPYNAHEQGPRINGWHDPTLHQTLAYCAARYDSLVSTGN